MTAAVAAGRYARAFWLWTEAEAVTDEARGGLLALRALLRESPEFRALVEARGADGHGRQARALRAALEGRVPPAVLRFVLFLEDRRRLALLPAAIEAFDAHVAAMRGVRRVTVVSARPLEPDLLERLTARLRTRHGGPTEVTLATDPALLAGFVVRTVDRVEDYSVAGGLRRARLRLAGEAVPAGGNRPWSKHG
jgi:F-type H+-transporting ATPase subunit delta